MSRIGPVPGTYCDVSQQIRMPAGRSAGADVLDDATVSTYLSAIGTALDISRDQARAIIANLKFIDFVAN